MSRRLLALILLSLALALGACGGDDEGDSGGSPPASQGGAEAPPPKDAKATPGAKVVDMKDVKYMPAEIDVEKGDTVRWTNSDSFAHTVTKEDGPGKDFDSGNIDGGGDYEHKFTDVGTIAYVCTIHPNQKGSVVVE